MSRRHRDERGAAMVEAAIIFPLVMLLTFGCIEFGIGFSQKGALESISRAGARTGATLATDQNTDINVPQETPDNSIGVDTARAVNAALGTTAAPTLDRLLVYQVTSAGVPSGAIGSCADVPSGFCMEFTPDPGQNNRRFALGSVQGSWPMPQRASCVLNADRIGVQVEGTFKFLTNIVGIGTIPLRAVSVLQLEPTGC